MPKKRELPPSEPSLDQVEILRLKAVMRRVGLCRSSIYALAASGDFPQPVKLSERAVGWLSSEINDFIQQRISERHGRAK